MHRSCLAIALLAALTAPAFAAQKFDARLQRMTQDAVAFQHELLEQKRGPISTMDVIVRVRGQGIEQLRREGARIRSIIGDIVTADIPAARIGAIAGLDGVVYIEASRRLPLRLNASVPATRASQLRSGVTGSFTGVTGKGVLVGIVDDGLDFRHRDFRNADGSTRLVALWDQRETATYGSPPTGFTYGTECTPQMIDSAIAGTGGCQQPSTGGHGTHVGGIAAGNGRATGNGRAADRFIGMAPEADIIAANSIGGGAPGSAVLDAVNFMGARAKSLGKPIAINLSLGSYFGPRDGTSNFEKGLDNASGAGVVIAGAAGNEADAPIRATANLAQGGTAQFRVRLPAESNATSGRAEIWYPGTSAYSVSVTPPGCAATPPVAPGDPAQSQETACGAISVTSTDTQANNDDRQILIEFTAGNAAVVRNQDYVITITGTTVTGGSATVSAICGETAGGMVFSAGTETVTTQILTDASSATRVIAVAAYNTNYQWTSLNGARNHPGHGAISDLSSFSSRGPRRNCSNAAKCPPVMKPEITAPGSMIMAAYSSDISASDASGNGDIEADGVHTAYNGTSMATPHATGAVALLLSKSPTLTPEQVKALLFANVQTNSFTTALPTYDPASPLVPAIQNLSFGYGILDVKKAYDAASSPGTSFAANVRTVVSSFYTTILGRSADQAGLDFWAAEATRVAGLGADVKEVFYAMAMQFFASSEYVGRNTSDTQYLTDLYQTFFKRAPSASELNYWQGELTAAQSRSALLNSFLFAQEFSNAMSALFGASNVRPEVNMTMDLYRGTYGRLPDSAGFSGWLGVIRQAQCQGATQVSTTLNTVLGAFFNSPEYGNRARSDRDFMGDVYNAYMRRGPGGDTGGFIFWVGQVASAGRDGVRSQFVPSAEFQARVAAIVGAGCAQ